MTEPRKLDKEDFTRMNMPREFWAASSDQIAPSVLPSIRNYGTNIKAMLAEGLGFVLTGPAGVGKTGIAAVLAKIAKCYGYSVFFVTVSDLRELVRSHINFDERSILERCKDVDLLVLDNLKEEDAKDLVINASALESLVERRVAWKQSTIITTRIKPGSFPELFPGLWEILKARSPFLGVEGENRRTQAAKDVRARLIVPLGNDQIAKKEGK